MWRVEYKDRYSLNPRWNHQDFLTSEEAMKFLSSLDWVKYEWFEPVYIKGLEGEIA